MSKSKIHNFTRLDNFDCAALLVYKNTLLTDIHKTDTTYKQFKYSIRMEPSLYEHHRQLVF